MNADLAIRGGTVIDGTGNPGRRADLGIANGRITEIDQTVKAPKEIDATGRLVCPGFIDCHTHYDPQVLWDPWLSSSCWHGVTSVVAGSCGYSIAPTKAADRASLIRTLDKVEDMRVATLEAGVNWDFETYGEYLDVIQRRGLAVNFGGYVGHTAVRLYVMGQDAYEREATPEEINRMKAAVAEAIQGGALGFSTDRAGFHLGDGGRPVPSIAASQQETEALIGVTAEIGRGVVHVAPGELPLGIRPPAQAGPPAQLVVHPHLSGGRLLQGRLPHQTGRPPGRPGRRGRRVGSGHLPPHHPARHHDRAHLLLHHGLIQRAGGSGPRRPPHSVRRS